MSLAVVPGTKSSNGVSELVEPFAGDLGSVSATSTAAGPAATGVGRSRAGSAGAATAWPVLAGSDRGVPHELAPNVAQLSARAHSVAWILLMCIIGCRAPSNAERVFEFSRRAMGVEARILLQAPSIESAAAAADVAFAEIERLDACFSDWNEDSELSRLCGAAGTGPIAVSEDLFDILQRAQDISAATDGAFDVTVGPLVLLWREARRTRALPAVSVLAEARIRVGWQLVELDAPRKTVALARPGMRLDLGGIGKGYACQRALDTLARLGFERALVQMGGDIVCGAAPSGRVGWTIDVAGATHVVEHCAIATSGDTQQHIVIDGVRYGHVVDPRTGLGRTSGRVVTIRARDGATADALATAFGEREGDDRTTDWRMAGVRVVAVEEPSRP